MGADDPGVPRVPRVRGQALVHGGMEGSPVGSHDPDGSRGLVGRAVMPSERSSPARTTRARTQEQPGGRRREEWSLVVGRSPLALWGGGRPTSLVAESSRCGGNISQGIPPPPQPRRKQSRGTSAQPAAGSSSVSRIAPALARSFAVRSITDVSERACAASRDGRPFEARPQDQPGGRRCEEWSLVVSRSPRAPRGGGRPISLVSSRCGGIVSQGLPPPSPNSHVECL